MVSLGLECLRNMDDLSMVRSECVRGQVAVFDWVIIDTTLTASWNGKDGCDPG